MLPLKKQHRLAAHFAGHIPIMRWTKEREMQATRNTRRIRFWCDWLLLAAGLVALLVPLELVADAAYRGHQSILD
jgi:hypothetical protein